MFYFVTSCFLFSCTCHLLLIRLPGACHHRFNKIRVWHKCLTLRTGGWKTGREGWMWGSELSFYVSLGWMYWRLGRLTCLFSTKVFRRWLRGTSCSGCILRVEELVPEWHQHSAGLATEWCGSEVVLILPGKANQFINVCRLHQFWNQHYT